MVRPPCCDKLNLKRGLWTAQEDAKILAYVSKHGTGNWTAVPKKAGLKRCGKSCRLRWTNYLRPDLKHDSFTPQEEEMIVMLHAAIGSRWSIIAQQLPGRTDNDVKNHWNTKLRKKLSEMGIDPVTHKPFSQILAEYGNIGGLRKPGSRIGSLNKDFKNVTMLKSEPYPCPPQGFPNISSQLVPSTTSPQTAPIQDTFLSRNQANNNHSFDLLAELQAIKLVTEVSNCSHNNTHPPPIFLEDSLSSSSSSSPTCSTAAQENSPLDLSWHDFLLDDAFLAADPQEQEISAEHSSKEFASQNQNVIQKNETNKEAAIEECIQAKGTDCEILSNDFQPSSSSEISFVEAMLDQEYRMFLDFPNLLEEPFYY
ncbi:hypothetical protein I3842_12G018800 [Carya illinoinensis]|uniref:Uncharacterized protein n=1 Tax=Carya illinoinensis TaxID=32201 RepID=A0A922IUL6_CARIL|nr:hypothetical protein I3842_12G018800 [Carya illinoinensis]